MRSPGSIGISASTLSRSTSPSRFVSVSAERTTGTRRLSSWSALIELTVEKKACVGAPSRPMPSNWSSSLYAYATLGCSRNVAVRSQNAGTPVYARKNGSESSTNVVKT